MQKNLATFIVEAWRQVKCVLYNQAIDRARTCPVEDFCQVWVSHSAMVHCSPVSHTHILSLSISSLTLYALPPLPYPPPLSLSLSLSISLCLSVSLSLCPLSLSICISIFPSLSPPYLSFSLSYSVSLSLCLSLLPHPPLSPSFSLSPSLFLTSSPDHTTPCVPPSLMVISPGQLVTAIDQQSDIGDWSDITWNDTGTTMPRTAPTVLDPPIPELPVCLRACVCICIVQLSATCVCVYMVSACASSHSSQWRFWLGLSLSS